MVGSEQSGLNRDLDLYRGAFGQIKESSSDAVRSQDGPIPGANHYDIP